jgi:hypothetical protein
MKKRTRKLIKPMLHVLMGDRELVSYPLDADTLTDSPRLDIVSFDADGFTLSVGDQEVTYPDVPAE